MKKGDSKSGKRISVAPHYSLSTLFATPGGAQGASTLNTAMSFFQRVLNHLLHTVVVEGLANK